MNQHTQGPWSITHDSFIVAGEGALIADCEESTVLERPANVLLIAAAPELFAAALIATAEIECYCCDVGVAVKGACGKCHLVAAIAKAEGRS